MTENCQNCLFHAEGFCHRYPPQVVAYAESGYDRVTEKDAVSTSTNSEFPNVLPTNWCGEWKHKPGY